MTSQARSATNMIETQDWARWLHEPITQALLFSLALHFAMIVVVQPAPGKPGRQTVVINAYLQNPAEPPMPMPKTAPVPMPQAEAPVVVADAAPKLLANVLVATTPSPAPPIPVMPMAPEPVKNNAAEIKVSSPLSALVSAAPLADVSKSVNKSPGAPQTSGLPSLPIGIDTNWYQARQVDNQPKAIGVIEPVYPEEAKRRNQEGTLKLMLKIDDLGRVQSAEVVEASPPGVFDAAALEAFKSARFQPAMREGRPVRYQAFIRVDFKLKD